MMRCCKCTKNNEVNKCAVKAVVLLGAPGSGKGTIAQHLLDNYNAVHFSTGNLLRNEVKKDTAIGKKVSSILRAGGLVNDDIVNAVVESNLLQALSADGVILLDGYPRTVDQAKFLDSIKSGELAASIRVIEIDVDYEVIVSRIAGRLVCADCGATFHSANLMKDGKLNNICSRCDGNLIKRADDTEEIVRNRLKEYVDITLPVSRYYGDRLLKVSGDVSPELVMQSVDNIFCDFGIKKRR